MPSKRQFLYQSERHEVIALVSHFHGPFPHSILRPASESAHSAVRKASLCAKINAHRHGLWLAKMSLVGLTLAGGALHRSPDHEIYQNKTKAFI